MNSKKLASFVSGSLLLGLIMLMLMTTAVNAQTAQDQFLLMQQANQQYEAGNYEQAIELYETVRHQQVQDSALFYNLGNAYFRHGDLGHAILNYRRAQQLAPRDPDVNANLLLAQSQTVDQLVDGPQGVFDAVAFLTKNWLSLNELAMGALFFWVLLNLVAMPLFFWQKTRLASQISGGVLLLGLLFCLLSIGSRLYLQYQYPLVVVTTEEVEVTSGPGVGERYPMQFIIHAGVEARILESDPAWRHLQLPNGLEGWVPAETVTTVGM